MSIVAVLRELNAKHSPDDAPLWAEGLGVVLVVGLLVRSASHVVTALIVSTLGDEIDPQMADYDATLASPVLALRGQRFDVTARFASAMIGIGMWGRIAVPADQPLVAAWVAAQWLVCIGDPLAFVAWRAKERFKNSDISPRENMNVKTQSRDRQNRQNTNRGGD